MVKNRIQFRRLAVEALHAADGKHGENILIYDIRKLTPIADYMMLVTVNSPPHARAVVEEIKEVCTRSSVQLLRQDGARDSAWIVLDYGGLIIHTMHQEARVYYGLEKLWREARIVQWLKNSSDKK